jgi:hypothetical protein
MGQEQSNAGQDALMSGLSGKGTSSQSAQDSGVSLFDTVRLRRSDEMQGCISKFKVESPKSEQKNKRKIALYVPLHLGLQFYELAFAAWTIPLFSSCRRNEACEFGIKVGHHPA